MGRWESVYNESNTAILERILDRVPNDLPKIEGTFLYDGASGISHELAESKLQLDEVLKRVFATTAAENGYSNELEKRCAEVGVYRKGGVKAIGQVTFTGADNIVVPVNTLVQTAGGLQFKTLADVTLTDGSAIADIEAVSIGSQYNLPANTIVELPVQIIGVTAVTNNVETLGGTNIESDNDLLNRYLLQVRMPATSGNANQYKLWALEVDGVGDTKVFPLWDGAGTVKVIVVDNNKQISSQDIINNVVDYIEIKRPICVAVTVTSPTEKAINISAKVVLSEGYILSDVQQNFEQSIEKYRQDIVFQETYVSYAKIGNILLSTSGVIDYSDLKLNDSTINVPLEAEEIPVIGTVGLEV